MSIMHSKKENIFFKPDQWYLSIGIGSDGWSGAPKVGKYLKMILKDAELLSNLKHVDRRCSVRISCTEYQKLKANGLGINSHSPDPAVGNRLIPPKASRYITSVKKIFFYSVDMY